MGVNALLWACLGWHAALPKVWCTRWMPLLWGSVRRVSRGIEGVVATVIYSYYDPWNVLNFFLFSFCVVIKCKILALLVVL